MLELFIWNAWCLHFGVLGDLGTILGTGEHKKGHFEVQAWILLLIFGSESGCLGLENQAFGMTGVAKTNFRRYWNSHESRGDFS